MFITTFDPKHGRQDIILKHEQEQIVANELQLCVIYVCKFIYLEITHIFNFF